MEGLIRSTNGKLVEFFSSDGLKQHGFLFGNAGGSTAIVHMHGMTGNFYRSGLSAAMARRTAKLGASVFAINTRGHDVVSTFRKRVGKEDVGGIALGTSLERFEDSWMDVRGAIAAMAGMGFRNIILSGHSTGCQKAAYYQYKMGDKRVKGIILLAPADDYNVNRKELGKAWAATVKASKRLCKSRKGNFMENGSNGRGWFSAQRFLSVADLRRVESRLFNYDGKLREFGSLTVPILAVFGSKEEHAPKPVSECLKLLESRTTSKSFTQRVIDGAGHNFYGQEDEVAAAVAEWMRDMRGRGK